METVLQDVRIALRGFRRSPAFFLTAIATLALGIGATTAIFTTLSAVLLEPLPYAQEEELAVFWMPHDWSEEEFLQRTEGSAIRRSGYARWLRNIAVALGNAAATPETMAALESRRHVDDAVVREHVEWALERHKAP